MKPRYFVKKTYKPRGFIKKVKLFHKNIWFHIEKRMIQITPYNRPFKNGSLFFLRKKSIKKFVTWNFNGNIWPLENCLVVFFNKLLKLRAVIQPKLLGFRKKWNQRSLWCHLPFFLRFWYETPRDFWSVLWRKIKFQHKTSFIFFLLWHSFRETGETMVTFYVFLAQKWNWLWFDELKWLKL